MASEMTTYMWNEPGENGEDLTQTITDVEILAQYGPYWRKQMRRVGKDSQINDENCIDDFVTVHWAWELPPSTKV